MVQRKGHHVIVRSPGTKDLQEGSPPSCPHFDLTVVDRFSPPTSQLALFQVKKEVKVSDMPKTGARSLLRPPSRPGRSKGRRRCRE